MVYVLGFVANALNGLRSRRRPRARYGSTGALRPATGGAATPSTAIRWATVMIQPRALPRSGSNRELCRHRCRYAERVTSSARTGSFTTRSTSPNSRRQVWSYSSANATWSPCPDFRRSSAGSTAPDVAGESVRPEAWTLHEPAVMPSIMGRRAMPWSAASRRTQVCRRLSSPRSAARRGDGHSSGSPAGPALGFDCVAVAGSEDRAPRGFGCVTGSTRAEPTRALPGDETLLDRPELSSFDVHGRR